MTTNKILSITCIVAIASTLGLAYFWDDFLGGLSVNVSMDRELALEEAKAASEDFEILGNNLDQAAAYSFSSSIEIVVLELVAIINAGIARKEALAKPCRIPSICMASIVLFLPAFFQRFF
jgi:hypothetical protein